MGCGAARFFRQIHARLAEPSQTTPLRYSNLPKGLGRFRQVATQTAFMPITPAVSGAVSNLTKTIAITKILTLVIRITGKALFCHSI